MSNCHSLAVGTLAPAAPTGPLPPVGGGGTYSAVELLFAGFGSGFSSEEIAAVAFIADAVVTTGMLTR